MDNYHFSHYVVAWMDLLGQGEKLEQFNEIPTDKEQEKDFLKKVAPTFGHVIEFRKAIAKLRETLSGKLDIPGHIRQSVSKEKILLHKKYTAVDVSVQFLADAAALKVPILSGDAYSPLLSIEVLLNTLAIVMLGGLSSGMVMRGGISVGICAELNKNDLYGQAMSRAYLLESKCAVYPRIVVGKPFLGYLKHCRTINVPSQELGIVNMLVTYIERSLERDADGRVILSFLGPKFREIYGNRENFRKGIEKASRFIHKEIERYTQIEQIDRQKKYMSLKAYFERQKCWIS